MANSLKLKPMDRRSFLKRGVQSGAAFVTLPFWSRLLFPEGEVPPGLEVPEPFAISAEDLRKLLQVALAHGGEFAEVYLEYTVENSLGLDEDKISNATRGVKMGAGFRVIQGEKTGYAFSDDLSYPRLKEAAETAALIANGGRGAVAQVLKAIRPPSYYQVRVSPERVAAKGKVELLTRANGVARAFDKRITQVGVSFYDTNKRIRIANSEGLLGEDTQTLSYFGIGVSARDGEQRSRGGESTAGSYGFEHFPVTLAEAHARKAAEMAVRLLPAEDAPAGEFPIVIAAGYGGIFFHEAIGHSLEGDGIRKKTSCFWDKLGQPIAAPAVNLVDDGSYPGGWGAANVDDEGCIGQKTLLIDKGVCSGFLQDKLNAGLMKAKQTGNGRRESYQNYPIPRMTNTYLLSGASRPDEIVASVDKGVFIAKIGGGNVQPTTGRFVFSVPEGYLIEGGKVTRPLKGIMLMGSGQDVLKNISMVGNDLLVIGGGSCGKDGQSKPVGFGNPTLKVDRITIGGRKA
jgi:TldD protein